MTDEPSTKTGRPRRGYRHRVMAVLFGDRLGLTLFFGVLAWTIVWWRIGFFITDSTTIANTLANVGDGRLAVVETPYSLTLGSQPGLHRVGDQLFGRNYGHVLVSLPVLWFLDGLSLVADVRLLLVGGWSLLLVVLARQVAAVTGRRRVVTAGSVVAVVLFVGNVATATSLSEGRVPWAASSTALGGAPLELIALQVTTMLAAALAATTMYRLLARFHGRRVGTAAGIAVVLATPLGFWASIPKRHVLTATAILITVYCFAVSREQTGRRGRMARAGAYAAVGLLTTVHPFEALFMFLVLVPLDLLTAPSNDPRSLGLVSLIFFISLLPFFLLNTLIAGNPLRPPRVLDSAGASPDLTPSPETDPSGGDSGGGSSSGDGGDGGGGGSSGDGGDSGSGGSSGGDGSNSGDGGNGGGFSIEPLLAPLMRGVGYVDRIIGFASRAVTSGFDRLSNLDSLYHIFIRSGRIPGIRYALNSYETVELAFIESFPLVAALLWLPVTAIEGVRASVDRSWLGQPTRQTDLLATAFAVVFTVVYLPRLPLHSMITLRYILPVMPLALYGVVRLAVVRRPVDTVPQWVAGSYVAVVVGGGLAVVGALAAIDPAIGEAVQFHALLGLGTATVAAVCVTTWPVHDSDRLLAVGIAVPAGATTVFLILSSLSYFDYGRYALGLTRELAGLIPILYTVG